MRCSKQEPFISLYGGLFLTNLVLDGRATVPFLRAAVTTPESTSTMLMTAFRSTRRSRRATGRTSSR